jgi:tRNA-dihydrouridine synthase C
MLVPDRPALILAPMEGVTDAPMRAVMGELRAFTFAVAEFLRVSQVPLPRAVIRKHVPELRAGGRTPTGMPVQVQLLGGDPGRLAETAVAAVEAGAWGIDLNFGCPAKTVNRNDGGATLLKYPHRLRAIVAAVRAAVPAHLPVSAKMRLGWDSTDAVFENAAMAAEGGASWVTVHARTREQGYAPPVDWALVGRVRERLGVPVVANGDVWTLADFRRCRDESGCRHFMLGRGALADPRLPAQVARELGLPHTEPPGELDWPVYLRRLVARTEEDGGFTPAGTLRRVKQWLHTAEKYGEFRGFEVAKRAKTCDELLEGLAVPK